MLDGQLRTSKTPVQPQGRASRVTYKDPELEAIRARIDCRELFRQEYRENYERQKEGKYACPWHDDSKPSLMVKEDRVHCFGCGAHEDCFGIIMRSRGIDLPEAKRILRAMPGVAPQRAKATKEKKPKPHPTREAAEKAAVSWKKSEIVERYVYRNEDGSPSYWILKHQNKSFTPLCEDKGKWFIALIKPRILYGLPEVLAADMNDAVLLVEGEKDRDSTTNKLNLVSVAIPFGSKSVKRFHQDNGFAPLKDRIVICCGDCDDAGKDFNQTAAKVLSRGIAKEIRVLSIPNPKNVQGYDITNLIEDLGPEEARKMILELIEAAPAYEPEPEAESTQKKADRSLGSLIAGMLKRYKSDRVDPNYSRITKAVFDWFKDHGAAFFVTCSGEPFMSFRKRTYRLNSSNRLEKGRFEGLLFQEANLLQINTPGRAISEGMRHMCLIHGKRLNELSWCHTDIDSHAIYFGLNNDDQEIVKINSSGITVMSNGDNPDGILLSESQRKMKPLSLVDIDPAEGWRLVAEHVMTPLACSKQDGLMIFLWFCAFLLADFVSMRPMLRGQGPQGSGKTWLSKLLSALFFGEPFHEKFTVAAAFADAERSPIQCFDNLETDAAKEDLIEYFLLVTSGAVKEMRNTGTAQDTIIFRPRTLVHSNGIDPIGSDLREFLRRVLIVEFSREHMNPSGFMESESLANVVKHRNAIMSYLLGITQRCLAVIERGALRQVKCLLDEALPGHSKSGSNDYLAIMYIANLVSQRQQLPEMPITSLHSSFVQWIRQQDADARIAGAEGNETVMLLHALLTKARMAIQKGDSSHYDFKERYHLAVEPPGTIYQVPAKDIVFAMNRIAKESGLPCKIKASINFSQRLVSEADSIKAANIDISYIERRSHTRLYTIRRKTENLQDGENLRDGENPVKASVIDFTTRKSAPEATL